MATPMRFPLTETVPLATGRLLARIVTSSSSVASNSMMAPRLMRSIWWMGMVVAPSTTEISQITSLIDAKTAPRNPHEFSTAMVSE
jgi:hypothetical protein